VAPEHSTPKKASAEVGSANNQPIASEAPGGPLAARLARCRVSRRRSLDRTEISHSTVTAAIALHAPQPTFDCGAGKVSMGW
jgi:hypothetical protein